MRFFLNLKLLLLFVFLFTNGSAAVILLNSQKEDFQIPENDLRIIMDKTGHLNFETIRAIESYRFTRVTDKLPAGVHYWVTFTLRDSTGLNNWFLQLPLHSNLIDLYFSCSSENKVTEYHTGQSLPFQNRPIDARTFLFDLPLRKNEPLNVYIHLFSEKHSDFSFIVSKKHNYLEVHTKGYLFLGLIYGILFLMMLYNLVLYFSFRDKIYLWYVLYVLSSALFLSWKDGMGFQFLWPNFPIINQYHHLIALFFLVFTFLLYTTEFLNLDKFIKSADKGFYILISLLSLHLLAALFDKSYFEPFPVLYLITFSGLFAASVYLYFIKSFKPAIYSILSIVCILIAFSIIKLRYLSVLEWNWFNEYILNYAVVTEAIIMSLAIKDKISFLKGKEAEVNEVYTKKQELIVENEIINRKSIGLEWELKNQNNELAALSEFLNQKTEFLDYLKKELENLSEKQQDNTSIKKLIKEITKETELENHWEQFQINFNKAHDNLLHQLKTLYPLLKPADLLLCAYIKLGKSNKEIASMLNISIAGVEKRRVRLKEKLNLENEIKLTEFINNFNNS